jgi:hypothetical protein
MSDIIESNTKTGITFSANTTRAAAWMRDNVGRSEVTYSLKSQNASLFRQAARAAKLTIAAR